MSTDTLVFNTLLVEERGKTLIIFLNRPKVFNALNSEIITEIEGAIKYLHSSPRLYGAIITGVGEKAFAAGADIAEVNGIPADEVVAFSKAGQDVFTLIESGSKPVIAAVNGFALGGGCELAMACHLRVASTNAKFGQPEVNLGLMAGYGGTQRLTRLVGRSKATEMLLLGDPIKAEEAKEIGLANYVVLREDLLAKCLEILEKIYQKSPLAIKLTLEAIQTGCYHPALGMAKEAENFGKALNSHDGREGTLAFIEKRNPRFMGE